MHFRVSGGEVEMEKSKSGTGGEAAAVVRRKHEGPGTRAAGAQPLARRGR